jgi:pimeloyl-ACP methyl ester carboxylesterase
VGPLGDWWSPQGEKTLERTLTWLERRGIRRVYLAGLSNGGVGASVLAGRLTRSRLELRGLVLISGASRVADTPRVPVLMVQGRHDSMFPARRMRAFAERTGNLATYFEVDSGHFAFLDHRLVAPLPHRLQLKGPLHPTSFDDKGETRISYIAVD